MVPVPCGAPRNGPTLAGVNRTGLATLAGVLVGASALGAGCGSELSDDALPPMYTTTTTTTVLTTTTIAVSATYEIRSGDKLGNIARQFGVDLQELMTVNGITDPNMIQAGDVLSIPASTAPGGVDAPSTSGA